MFVTFLILKKSIFRSLPYEKLESYEGLFKQTEFPTWECFYSRLKAQSITLECYKRAKEIWLEYECRTMRDFLIIYQTR